MTIDAQIADLQHRLTAAGRARARAEAERDAAAANADRARRQLAEEFGVSTAADAAALLSQLETALGADIATLAARLDALGV